MAFDKYEFAKALLFKKLREDSHSYFRKEKREFTPFARHFITYSPCKEHRNIAPELTQRYYSNYFSFNMASHCNCHDLQEHCIEIYDDDKKEYDALVKKVFAYRYKDVEEVPLINFNSKIITKMLSILDALNANMCTVHQDWRDSVTKDFASIKKPIITCCF